MKLNIKKPKLNFREKTAKHSRRFHLPRFRGKMPAAAEAGQGFDVVVRPSEPIMTVSAEKKHAGWQNVLLRNLSCALLITSALSIFCMCIYEPVLILCALPCLVVFMAITTAEYLKPGKLRFIIAAVLAGILLITLIIWRSTILGGLAMLINSFYDVAEEAQAYLYDRVPGGDYASVAGSRIGMAWASCLIGLLTALPPLRFRRVTAFVTAAAVMLALAYYGLLPAIPCVAVFAAAVLISMSRGGVLSVLPVMLASLLLFGAVILADPGEIYGISQMDENFRDRFAFNTALIESGDEMEEDLYDESEEYDEEYSEEEEDESYEESGNGSFVIIGFIIAIVAAAGAAAYLIHRRLAKRRALYRRGITSKDPREAVTAMFPYTVRWLQGFGVDLPEPAFTSMIPSVKEKFEESYLNRFTEMYELWSEAAYSDHQVSEDSRILMNAFMKDTISTVKKNSKLKDKLRMHFRYAL